MLKRLVVVVLLVLALPSSVYLVQHRYQISSLAGGPNICTWETCGDDQEKWAAGAAAAEGKAQENPAVAEQVQEIINTASSDQKQVQHIEAVLNTNLNESEKQALGGILTDTQKQSLGNTLAPTTVSSTPTAIENVCFLPGMNCVGDDWTYGVELAKKPGQALKDNKNPSLIAKLKEQIKDPEFAKNNTAVVNALVEQDESLKQTVGTQTSAHISDAAKKLLEEKNKECSQTTGLCPMIDPDTLAVVGWVPSDKAVFGNYQQAIIARSNLSIGDTTTQVKIGNNTYTLANPDFKFDITAEEASKIKELADKQKIGSDTNNRAVLDPAKYDLGKIQKQLEDFEAQRIEAEKAIADQILQTGNKDNYQYLSPEMKKQVDELLKKNADIKRAADAALRGDNSAKDKLPEDQQAKVEEIVKDAKEQETYLKNKVEALAKEADPEIRAQILSGLNESQKKYVEEAAAQIALVNKQNEEIRQKNIDIVAQQIAQVDRDSTLSDDQKSAEFEKVSNQLESDSEAIKLATSKAVQQITKEQETIKMQEQKIANIKIDLDLAKQATTGNKTFDDAVKIITGIANGEIKTDTLAKLIYGQITQANNRPGDPLADLLSLRPGAQVAKLTLSDPTLPQNQKLIAKSLDSPALQLKLKENYYTDLVNNYYSASDKSSCVWGVSSSCEQIKEKIDKYKADLPPEQIRNIYKQALIKNITNLDNNSIAVKEALLKTLSESRIGDLELDVDKTLVETTNLGIKDWQDYQKLNDNWTYLAYSYGSGQQFSNNIQQAIESGQVKPADMEKHIEAVAWSDPITSLATAYNIFTQGGAQRNLVSQSVGYEQKRQEYIQKYNVDPGYDPTKLEYWKANTEAWAGGLVNTIPVVTNGVIGLFNQETADKVIPITEYQRNSADYVRAGVAFAAPAASVIAPIAALPFAPLGVVGLLTTGQTAFGSYASLGSLGNTAELCTFRPDMDRVGCGLAFGNTVYMVGNTISGLARGTISIAEAQVAKDVALVNQNTTYQQALKIVKGGAGVKAAAFNAGSPVERIAYSLSSGAGAATFIPKALLSCTGAATQQQGASWADCIVSGTMGAASVFRSLNLFLPFTRNEAIGVWTGRIAEAGDQLDGFASCADLSFNSGNKNVPNRFNPFECALGIYDAYGDNLAGHWNKGEALFGQQDRTVTNGSFAKLQAAINAKNEALIKQYTAEAISNLGHLQANNIQVNPDLSNADAAIDRLKQEYQKQFLLNISKDIKSPEIAKLRTLLNTTTDFPTVALDLTTAILTNNPKIFTADQLKQLENELKSQINNLTAQADVISDQIEALETAEVVAQPEINRLQALKNTLEEKTFELFNKIADIGIARSQVAQAPPPAPVAPGARSQELASSPRFVVKGIGLYELGSDNLYHAMGPSTEGSRKVETQLNRDRIARNNQPLAQLPIIQQPTSIPQTSLVNTAINFAKALAIGGINPYQMYQNWRTAQAQPVLVSQQSTQPTTIQNLLPVAQEVPGVSVTESQISKKSWIDILPFPKIWKSSRGGDSNSGETLMLYVDNWDGLWDAPDSILTLTPKISQGVKVVGDEYYDSRLASEINGSIIFNNQSYKRLTKPEEGYSRDTRVDEKDVPVIANGKRLIFRGINYEQMQKMIASGKIGAGEVVEKIGVSGQIFFSSKPDMAFGYAAERGGFDMAQFNKPSFVIAIEWQDGFEENNSGEVISRTQIALDKTVHIYEIRPYVIKAGHIPLAQNSQGKFMNLPDTTKLADTAPQGQFVYRQANLEEIINLYGDVDSTKPTTIAKDTQSDTQPRTPQVVSPAQNGLPQINANSIITTKVTGIKVVVNTADELNKSLVALPIGIVVLIDGQEYKKTSDTNWVSVNQPVTQNMVSRIATAVAPHIPLMDKAFGEIGSQALGRFGGFVGPKLEQVINATANAITQAFARPGIGNIENKQDLQIEKIEQTQIPQEIQKVLGEHPSPQTFYEDADSLFKIVSTSEEFAYILLRSPSDSTENLPVANNHRAQVQEKVLKSFVDALNMFRLFHPSYKPGLIVIETRTSNQTFAYLSYENNKFIFYDSVIKDIESNPTSVNAGILHELIHHYFAQLANDQFENLQYEETYPNIIEFIFTDESRKEYFEALNKGGTKYEKHEVDLHKIKPLLIRVAYELFNTNIDQSDFDALWNFYRSLTKTDKIKAVASIFINFENGIPIAEFVINSPTQPPHTGTANSNRTLALQNAGRAAGEFTRKMLTNSIPILGELVDVAIAPNENPLSIPVTNITNVWNRAVAQVRDWFAKKPTVVPSQSAPTNFVEYFLNGKKYTDPSLPQQLLSDHFSIKSKYDLPKRDIRFENPSEYIRQLREIARKNNIPIRDKSEFQQFFDENPIAGAVYDGKGRQIFVDLSKDPIALAGDLEHELIHALQHIKYPGLPTELQEYEAYVGANMRIGEDFLNDPENIANVFGAIGSSVKNWYENEKLPIPWGTTQQSPTTVTDDSNRALALQSAVRNIATNAIPFANALVDYLDSEPMESTISIPVTDIANGWNRAIAQVRGWFAKKSSVTPTVPLQNPTNFEAKIIQEIQRAIDSGWPKNTPLTILQSGGQNVQHSTLGKYLDQIPAIRLIEDGLRPGSNIQLSYLLGRSGDTFLQLYIYKDLNGNLTYQINGSGLDEYNSPDIRQFILDGLLNPRSRTTQGSSVLDYYRDLWSIIRNRPLVLGETFIWWFNMRPQTVVQPQPAPQSQSQETGTVTGVILNQWGIDLNTVSEPVRNIITDNIFDPGFAGQLAPQEGKTPEDGAPLPVVRSSQLSALISAGAQVIATIDLPDVRAQNDISYLNGNYYFREKIKSALELLPGSIAVRIDGDKFVFVNFTQINNTLSEPEFHILANDPVRTFSTQNIDISNFFVHHPEFTNGLDPNLQKFLTVAFEDKVLNNPKAFKDYKHMLVHLKATGQTEFVAVKIDTPVYTKTKNDIESEAAGDGTIRQLAALIPGATIFRDGAVIYFVVPKGTPLSPIQNSTYTVTYPNGEVFTYPLRLFTSSSEFTLTAESFNQARSVTSDAIQSQIDAYVKSLSPDDPWLRNIYYNPHTSRGLANLRAAGKTEAEIEALKSHYRSAGINPENGKVAWVWSGEARSPDLRSRIYDVGRKVGLGIVGFTVVGATGLAIGSIYLNSLVATLTLTPPAPTVAITQTATPIAPKLTVTPPNAINDKQISYDVGSLIEGSPYKIQSFEEDGSLNILDTKTNTLKTVNKGETIESTFGVLEYTGPVSIDNKIVASFSPKVPAKLPAFLPLSLPGLGGGILGPISPVIIHQLTQVNWGPIITSLEAMPSYVIGWLKNTSPKLFNWLPNQINIPMPFGASVKTPQINQLDKLQQAEFAMVASWLEVHEPTPINNAPMLNLAYSLIPSMTTQRIFKVFEYIRDHPSILTAALEITKNKQGAFPVTIVQSLIEQTINPDDLGVSFALLYQIYYSGKVPDRLLTPISLEAWDAIQKIGKNNSTGKDIQRELDTLNKRIEERISTLKDEDSLNSTPGLRTSIGNEIEIVKNGIWSTGIVNKDEVLAYNQATVDYQIHPSGFLKQYLDEYKEKITLAQEKYKQKANLTAYLSVGSGKDGTYEFAPEPTSNYKVLIWELESLSKLGFIDFDDMSLDSFERGMHVTVGGDDVGISDPHQETLAIQAALLASGLGISKSEGEGATQVAEELKDSAALVNMYSSQRIQSSKFYDENLKTMYEDPTGSKIEIIGIDKNETRSDIFSKNNWIKTIQLRALEITDLKKMAENMRLMSRLFAAQKANTNDFTYDIYTEINNYLLANSNVTLNDLLDKFGKKTINSENTKYNLAISWQYFLRKVNDNFAIYSGNKVLTNYVDAHTPRGMTYLIGNLYDTFEKDKDIKPGERVNAYRATPPKDSLAAYQRALITEVANYVENQLKETALANKNPCEAYDLWQIVPTAYAADGVVNPCPLPQKIKYEIGKLFGFLGGTIRTLNPTPIPQPKSQETKYFCTGSKDKDGNDLIQSSDGKTYYCDSKFGMVCGEGRCNTGQTPSLIDNIQKLNDFELTLYSGFGLSDLKLQTEAVRLQKKYRILIRGQGWDIKRLELLDTALRDLPPDMYRNKLFHAAIDGGYVPKYQAAADLIFPVIYIDFAGTDSHSDNYWLDIIWHELGHSYSNSWGQLTDNTLPINYGSRIIQEIINKADWKLDPQNKTYVLSENSNTLNGFTYDKQAHEYKVTDCDPNGPDCNKMPDSLTQRYYPEHATYQFRTPQEMLAVWTDYYLTDSKQFCQNLKSYCSLMQDYFDNREYLNGVWINRPPQFGDQ